MSEANTVTMLVSPDGDDKSKDWYLATWRKYRQNRSLNETIAEIGSTTSKGSWNRAENGGDFNVEMRNALRRREGLPEIVVSAQDAVKRFAAQNVAVWFVGDIEDHADRIIMLDPEVDITFAQGGITLRGEPQNSGENDAVRPRTPSKRARRDTERYRAFNERRKAIGASWIQIHEAGLAVLETAAKLKGE